MIPGRSFIKNGQEWLYFSGTHYLGIPHNKQFQEKLQEGFQLYGTNFGGSRLSNLDLSIYEQAEAFLAKWTKAPTALTCSSGTLAGQLIVNYLAKDSPTFYAPDTHPALWPSNTISNGFSDRSSWQNYVLEASYKTNDNIYVFTNALDPLRLQSYSFKWLQQLNPSTLSTIIIDDSHGIGITGINGGGIYNQLNPPDNVQVVVTASLGKALGLPGGLLLGPNAIIGSIKSKALFGGASPISPAYLYAFLNTQELYQAARQELQANINLFLQSDKVRDLFNYQANYPVFYTKENKLAAFLAQQSILISSFPYPNASAPLITRVILNSLHTTADIQQLLEAIEKF